MGRISPAWRAGFYIALLVGLNFYIAQNLFFVNFTNNMQTNDGLFLAITRYILARFPHLNWFPFWFNGQPFENSYTPMLHLIDAAFAWVTGTSPAHAYNFITGVFYVLGPALLFVFAWRLTGFVETSFFAGLLYSLYSPAALLPLFRNEVGLWNPWRLRALVFWGEGPHIAVVALLPFALLAAQRAMATRKYLWCALAAVSMAWMVLVNAFAATDLAIGSACLLLIAPRNQMRKGFLTIVAIAISGYLLACAFLPPSLLRIVSYNSQFVDGDFRRARLIPAQIVTLFAVAAAWLATRRLRNAFLRFTILFATTLILVVGLFAFARLPALPQPHRYSFEMEMALCLLAPIALRPATVRLPKIVKALVVVLLLAAAVRQTIHVRRYARALTHAIDVTQTLDYKVARWLQDNRPGLRTFIGGPTGTWLNAFVDVPQMNSGQTPFDSNFQVDAMVIFSIYSDMNAGSRAAEVSILWLKAFGCHAIYVGPSPLGDVFAHPNKFEGVLPVLWRDGPGTIYDVLQRTKSLAHVIPENTLVQRMPIHGQDVKQVARYVAALDDAALPDAEMSWSSPDRARIETVVHPGQVLSVQVTYDPGWIAIANGKPVRISRDEIGLTAIRTGCDGPCSVDFIYEGTWERTICRALSCAALLAGLLAAFSAAFNHPKIRGAKD